MELERFLDLYANVRDVRKSTIDSYKWAIVSFTRHLGREATTGDLNDETVNAWLRSLGELNSPETVHTRRTTIKVIWNAAVALGYAEHSKILRQIKRPDRVIKTLTAEQIGRLIDAAESMRGKYCGYPKAEYYSSLIVATLESAMRQSDLHRLIWPDVRDARGKFQIVQFKTGHRRWVTFSDALMARITRWHGPTGLIWPRTSKGTVGRNLARLGRSIGVGRLTHTILRKTAITWVESHQPGTGWIFAGHASPDTTRRWYTDADRAYSDLRTPRLDDWRNPQNDGNLDNDGVRSPNR